MSTPTPDNPTLDSAAAPRDESKYADAAPGRAVLSAMYALTLIALALSVFLAVIAAREGQTIPGCGDGGTFDCGHVLKSKWSRVFDVPVGFVAAGAYAMVLVVLPFIGTGATPANKRWAWTLLLVAATGIAAAAAWFLTLQTAVIGSFCIYCVLTHATGAALALLIFFSAPLRVPPANGSSHQSANVQPLVSRQRLLLCVWVGLMTPILFAAGVRPQHVMLLREYSMPVSFVPEEFPALGDVTRGTVVMSLSDYTCPHCRATHEYLLKAMQRYGHAMAIVVMPLPLDKKCNPRIKETEKRHENACELARLALTVWRAKPSAFAEYDRWLFESEMPRRPVDARQKAIELVGDDAFDLAFADPWVDKTLGSAVNLYDKLGGGAIPKLLTPTILIAGQPADENELFGVLEHEAGIKPPPGVKPANKPTPVALPKPAAPSGDQFRIPMRRPAAAPASQPATQADDKPAFE